MPRALRWQRLNRHPKHRFSMLKNMAAGLFLHERIVTTEAKAKVLLPVVNRIFSRAIKNTSISRGKAAAWLKQKPAINKLYDNLLERYTVHAGGIAKLTTLAKNRRGDNSKMAVLELINK
jgi:large subunit ribosomal protein L17